MPAASRWSDYKVEELKRLLAAGYSASDIAEELGDGINRCAVLGKIFRLGLSQHKPLAPRKPRRTPRARIARRRVFPAPPPPPPPEPPPPKPRPAAAPARRLQLLQLQDHHCRWPHGDPHGHPFYFCAADRAAGDPYCRFHMKRAFAKPR